MEPITAFVTGADKVTGLGAARALSAAGAKVVGFARRPHSGICRSNAWSSITEIPDGDLEALADAVLSAAEVIKGPIFLLPTEDDHVRLFSRLAGDFPDHLRIAIPPADVVDLLLEKTLFLPWGVDRGLPLPRGVTVHSREELEAALENFSFPALLKPTTRTPGWQASSPLQKAIRVSSPEDLGDLDFDLFSAAPSHVLSEWIEGEDSDVLFCLAYLDSQSEVVASFCGRKLLQYPRLTGATAICVDIEDPALERLTADVLGEAGCRGLASLEVKRSATDGRYLITEPTVGRPNLQSAAAVSAGVNLHGIAMLDTWGRDYEDLLGPRRRCAWVEEGQVLNVLKNRFRASDSVTLPVGLIAKELLRARRVKGARFNLLDLKLLRAMASGLIRRSSG